jgi:hypothetical protein
VIPLLRKTLGDDVRHWAETHNLYGPVCSEMVYFLRDNDEEPLDIFTDLCHHEIRDRPASFTFERRKQLYGRWLSSGQPCLMLVHSNEGDVLGGFN